MDNYEKQVYTGRELFLKYNQDKLIEKYGLKHDEEYLYLKYIETEYRINRRNGAIEYATGEEWTDCREYTVVMTIYDFLCCSGQEILPPLTGQWQPVGRFVTAGSSPSTDPFVEKYARAFSGKVEEVKQACICLGGKQTKRLAGADLTFEPAGPPAGTCGGAGRSGWLSGPCCGPVRRPADRCSGCCCTPAGPADAAAGECNCYTWLFLRSASQFPRWNRRIRLRMGAVSFQLLLENTLSSEVS